VVPILTTAIKRGSLTYSYSFGKADWWYGKFSKAVR